MWDRTLINDPVQATKQYTYSIKWLSAASRFWKTLSRFSEWIATPGIWFDVGAGKVRTSQHRTLAIIHLTRGRRLAHRFKVTRKPPLSVANGEKPKELVPLLSAAQVLHALLQLPLI
jgi:hypothetical protein